MPDTLAIPEDEVSIKDDAPGTATAEECDLRARTVDANTDGVGKHSRPFRAALIVGGGRRGRSGRTIDGNGLHGQS